MGNKLSGPTTPENVRTQIVSSDRASGGALNSKAIRGVDENTFLDPVRNGLLRDSVSIKGGRNGLRKLRLAARSLNGPLQGSNVVYLHDHASYKPACTFVNKRARMTGHKEPCTVLDMPKAKRKQSPKRAKSHLRGADGLTVTERLKEAFDSYKAQGGTQKDIERACNRLMGWPPDADPPIVSQQVISAIYKGTIDGAASSATALIAAVLRVNPIWAQCGKGPREMPSPTDYERLDARVSALELGCKG